MTFVRADIGKMKQIYFSASERMITGAIKRLVHHSEEEIF